MNKHIILLLIRPALIPLTQNIGISIIQAKNKHQFRSVVYFIIAIINVILTIPLAKRFEGIGAAIGTLIATFLGQIIVMNIFYWKKIKLDIPKYWKFLIIFLLKVSVITVLNMIIIKNIEFNWIKLILGIIIYITMYTFIVLTTMNKEEKIYLKNIVEKVKKIFRKGE